MRTIEKILKDLFTENTGKNFLDSGGIYGRAWERNQTRDFDSEPPAKIEYWDGKFEYVTVNTYHYFKQVLDVDDVTETVNKYLRENNIHWTGEVEHEHFEELGFYDVELLNEWNTYNSENNTDHVFQGKFVKIDGEAYVLLQLHLGCDVRGGYSDVQLFKLEGMLTGFVEHTLYNNDKDISVDVRYPTEMSIYHHDTGEDEYIDSDWTDENILEGEGWDVELMICEDHCVY